MWLLGRIIYWCLLYQITGANYLICRHFKIRHILSVLQALLYTFGARIIYILFRSWYNHSSSFTIASVRIENHLGSWRRHQVLASWQSSQLNLVLPQSSCSTLVKISGRMLLVRLPGNPPNTFTKLLRTLKNTHQQDSAAPVVKLGRYKGAVSPVEPLSPI